MPHLHDHHFGALFATIVLSAPKDLARQGHLARAVAIRIKTDDMSDTIPPVLLDELIAPVKTIDACEHQLSALLRYPDKRATTA